MKGFLIDENLPYYFSLWNQEGYQHQKDLPKLRTDEQIWAFALTHELVIVTKDADFEGRILISDPPPKVIHIRCGNMRTKELYKFLNTHWPAVLTTLEEAKLVMLYPDRIESVKH